MKRHHQKRENLLIKIVAFIINFGGNKNFIWFFISLCDECLVKMERSSINKPRIFPKSLK